VNFNSLAEIADHFAKSAATTGAALHVGLEKCAVIVEKTAVKRFGHYLRTKSAGPFPRWAELSPITKGIRVRAGFPENEPLLRTGKLRGSIEHKTEGFEAVVGSKDPVMLEHELGIPGRLPRRAVLGPSLWVNKPKIKKILLAATLSGIAGGKQIDAKFNYDTELD